MAMHCIAMDHLFGFQGLPLLLCLLVFLVDHLHPCSIIRSKCRPHFFTQPHFLTLSYFSPHFFTQAHFSQLGPFFPCPIFNQTPICILRQFFTLLHFFTQPQFFSQLEIGRHLKEECSFFFKCLNDAATVYFH